MRKPTRVLVGALFVSACASTPDRRYTIDHRPSRPADCELEVYDEKNPRPPELVELGRLPATLGFYSPASTLLAALHPRACEAGALGMELEISGHSRSIGGKQRLRDVEVVFLALPAEETVTEPTEQISGAALRGLQRRMKKASGG